MLKRAPQQPSTRKRPAPNRREPLPAIPCTITIDGQVKITYPVTMIVSGIPLGITLNGAEPLSIHASTPTTLWLDFPAPPAPGDTVIIPGNTPEIRTRQGAYLAASRQLLA